VLTVKYCDYTYQQTGQVGSPRNSLVSCHNTQHVLSPPCRKQTEVPVH